MAGVKGKSGGARKGAGNPKGSKAKHTLEAQQLRQYLIKKLLRDAKGKKKKIKIIDKLVALAEGGNMVAIKEALDRALGRAGFEIGENGEGDIVIKITKFS